MIANGPRYVCEMVCCDRNVAVCENVLHVEDNVASLRVDLIQFGLACGYGFAHGGEHNGAKVHPEECDLRGW